VLLELPSLIIMFAASTSIGGPLSALSDETRFAIGGHFDFDDALDVGEQCYAWIHPAVE
jgi:hypothetical protein